MKSFQMRSEDQQLIWPAETVMIYFGVKSKSQHFVESQFLIWDPQNREFKTPYEKQLVDVTDVENYAHSLYYTFTLTGH